jgi:hypothetical protein
MAVGAALPILDPSPARPLRITPTDVSQFVRLEQCERFLRLRLAERAGSDFLAEARLGAQRISPLLSLSGQRFEREIERELAGRFRSIHYADRAGGAHNRPADNADLIREAARLKPGEVALAFQARLEAEIDGWRIRGDVDLIRMERAPEGELRLLVGDFKSTTRVKVEHRLQVAFYRAMLEGAFRAARVAIGEVPMGLIFRPPIDPTPEEEAETLPPLREAAGEWFGLDGPLLEIVDGPGAYLEAVRDLVLGPDSIARRVAGTPFAEAPYCLSAKCDGCLYGEFCMKWGAEAEDLSLLPYMNGTDKDALRRAGVGTVPALAALKEFAAPEGAALVPAPGREALVRTLAATWPIGAHLDELIHRAKVHQKVTRKDGSRALNQIPGMGISTLPAVRPDRNANLVWVYIDAQHDYLNDRIYLLGGLVVGCEGGEPSPSRRRSLVRMTDGPPESAADERALFEGWTRALVEAVCEVAHAVEGEDGTRRAPIHVVFYDRREQRRLLEALARNFPPILRHTPPLYDFLTQLAGLESPVATFLDEELRAFKNLPMTCPSLASIASLLKFDWAAPEPFRDWFRPRVFDYLAKLDRDGNPEWYTRRARFGSEIPLEYAYAAWGQLPEPAPGRGDEFADFRGIARAQLLAFQARRLEALEHVARDFRGDEHIEKAPFALPDIAQYDDKARDLAQALREFLLIERHVALKDWMGVRHRPPERRVLLGESLIARYDEADQEPAVAEANREFRRRLALRDEIRSAHEAANPGRGFRRTREQQAATDWSPEGLQFRLRIEGDGLDCDVGEALGLSKLREGDTVIVHPRRSVDVRRPEEERQPYTSTPRQILYGRRAVLRRIVAEPGGQGDEAARAFVEVELKESYGGDWSRGYTFRGKFLPLDEGEAYTIEPCPDDWYGHWCWRVAEGLCNGEPSRLYSLLVDPAAWGRSPEGLPGQAEFLAGLDAFRAKGFLHAFEPAKREFIGGYGDAPILLVQGPPGTGKSYGTAFAVLARLQAAMREDRPFRAFLSCKTHAATDVLLRNLLEARRLLGKLRDANPALFGHHFDPRLPEVPLYRVDPREATPAGIIPLEKDRRDGPKGPKNADVLSGDRWSVVGITPGGTYGLIKARWNNNLFGHALCDCLVLDEASQMNLPEALMAALPLADDGRVIVVGDHRQMPPIVRHDWEREGRRTFKEFEAYASLFDALRRRDPPMLRFAESFRLHAAMADFLREEVYRRDGIAYHSNRREALPFLGRPIADPLVAAALDPDYPLVVVVHDEAASQVRNPFEQSLIEPILRALADPDGHALDADEGLGVVVPHRAQRTALQRACPGLCQFDLSGGHPGRSAIDTVERFQGGERIAIVVGATESDRAYLLASGADFLLDPRRLTVALSRAKRKLILVASRSIFSLFSPDEELFERAQLWKNLLRRACPETLWEGARDGHRVVVRGGGLER